MKSMKNIAILSAVTMTLSGCSTIISGTTQPFSVETELAGGAKCELIDSKGARWVIPDTPGTVEITKGDGPLTVSCSKPGFKTAETVVEEGFAGATLGNVILGGGVGLVIDAASGAAQEYPDSVTLWLEPESFASKAEEEAFFAKKAEYEAAAEIAKKPQREEDDR